MFTPLESMKIINETNKNRISLLRQSFLARFKKATTWLIKIYQRFISPSLGNNCRFYPSCSEYTLQAIEKYGLMAGVFRGLRRIFRCHPWAAGGVDLP